MSMVNEFLNYNNFKSNKYYRAYLALANKIANEQRTYSSAYHENHHVLPDSFGGTIVLPYTFREHYIAHLLLPKFTIGKDTCKMTFALHTFFHFGYTQRLGLKFSSTIYEAHKRRFIEACSIRSSGKANPNYDDRVYTFKNGTTVFKGTRVDFLTKHSNTITQHDINSLIRAYKDTAKMSAKGWGIYIDAINKFSDEIPRGKITHKTRKCQHCAVVTTHSNLKRWHDDNCKLNPSRRT